MGLQFDESSPARCLSANPASVSPAGPLPQGPCATYALSLLTRFLPVTGPPSSRARGLQPVCLPLQGGNKSYFWYLSGGKTKSGGMCARGRFWWASGEHLLDRRMAKRKAASTVNSTHTNVEGLTSTVMCTRMKMVKGTPHFSLLPASHAMARMPLCAFQGLFYNMARTHSTNAEANTQCCSCGKFKSEKGFLICPSCNAVQPLNPTITHFQIFNQDEKFELDLKDLEAKYKSLMKKLHPDLSHGKSTEEKKNYAQLAARVTTAYNELLKPVSRGTYMLKLRGIHVEEEGTVTDSELIMEVMEIRETLQSSPDRKTLEQLHKRAMTRMDEWSTAFKSALKEGNDANAVGALQRMSYFGRVCEDINRELL